MSTTRSNPHAVTVAEGGAASSAPIVEVRWTDDGATVTGAEFSVDAACSAPSDTGRRDIRLEIQYRGAEGLTASVRFRVRLAEPTDRPWWLVPGVFYGENRPEGCDRVYPRFAVGVDDPAAMVSDHWEFRADRCAAPAVFCWTPDAGAALVTSETSAHDGTWFQPRRHDWTRDTAPDLPVQRGADQLRRVGPAAARGVAVA